MKDAHTFYEFPCSSMFAYVFPFNFVAKPNPNDSSKWTLIIRKSVINLVTDFYLNKLGGHNLLNQTVIHIQMNELEDIPNEDPIETIRRWAEKYESYARFSAGLLNKALSESFTRRTVFNYPRPGPLTITSFDETTQTTSTTSIDFYVLPLAPFTSIEESCPLVSQPKRTLSVASTAKVKSNRDSQSLSYLQKRFANNPIYRKLQQYFASHSDTAELLEQSASLNIIPANPIEDYRRRHSSLSPNISHSNADFSSEEEESINSARSFPAEVFRSLNLPFNKTTNVSLPSSLVNHLYALVNASSSSQNRRQCNQQTLEVKQTTHTKFFSGFVVPALSLAYLHITSFDAQMNDMIPFFADFMTHVHEWKQTNCTHFILDVRENPGGNVALALWMSAFLFPYHFPRSMPFSIPATPLARAYIDSSLANSPLKLMNP